MTPEDRRRNLNQRIAGIEQTLPTLATKGDLADAITSLATKHELRGEGARTRQHFDVVAERLEGQIRLLAEGQMALGERMRDLGAEIKADIAHLDHRVMRLEVRRPR